MLAERGRERKTERERRREGERGREGTQEQNISLTYSTRGKGKERDEGGKTLEVASNCPLSKVI